MALFITAFQVHKPNTKKELTKSFTTGKKPGLFLTKKKFLKSDEFSIPQGNVKRKNSEHSLRHASCDLPAWQAHT